MSMIDAKLGLLVGLLEDAQRRNQAAEAAAKKAQQAQGSGGGGGGGGEGGGGGGEGGCGAAKQSASPQAQQGARECQSACGAQAQQRVGEGGCSGASPERMQAQMPPRPSRGVGEGNPEDGAQNPPPDAQDPVRNPPPRRNPPPDVQDPVRNPPRNPPRNPSPDDTTNPPRNPSPDAAGANTRRVVPNAAAAQAKSEAQTKNAPYQDVEGADQAIAAEQKRQADAVQAQMNKNHPERVADAAPAAQAQAKADEKKPTNAQLAKVLEANPNIKTNQDLINHLYKEGGGDWGGAVKKAKEAGVKMTDLIADRQKKIGADDPSTNAANAANTDPAKVAPSKNDPSKTATSPDGPSSVPNQKQYKPGSPEQVALFKEAAKKAGLPESWATSPGLQNILRRESDGIVGRPNYTYGSRAKDSSQWDSIHKELQTGQKTAKSSATGLGQLLLSNVDKYYPSGRQGIGNPVEEAAGMMNYIKARYGNPENAWAQYGKRHEGY